MNFVVRFVVVGFLEHLIGSDSDFVEHVKIFDRHRRRIDIHTTDLSVPFTSCVFRVIDCFYGVGDIVRVRIGMFAVDADQTFVTNLTSKRFDFAVDLVHGENAAN